MLPTPASPTCAAPRAKALSIAFLLSLLVLLGGPGAATSHAADEAASMTVEATLAADGGLAVAERLTFPTAAPGEVTQRLATSRETLAKQEYVYGISDVAATVDGRAAQARVEEEGGYLVVTVPTDGGKVVELSYRAKGAVQEQAEGRTRFTWRLLQGLSVPVREFTGTVIVPGMIEDIKCDSGAPDATRTCNSYQAGTHENASPTFSDGPLGQGEIVDVSLGFGRGVVTANQQIHARWSLDRAFSISPLPLLAALGALALGGGALWMLHRRAGRDAAFQSPTRIAQWYPVAEGQSEFRLIGEIRPGQVGTLMDERVDPVDVTATIVDLAVRGHLRIIELERDGAHRGIDWTFERRTAKDPLQPYEERLLDALAPAGGEAQRVSRMGPAVAAAIPGVQDNLYDEMVASGWYEHRPDATRGRWATISWVGLALALLALVLLVWFTSFGWLGLVLVALGVGLVLVGQLMPARTTAGASLVGGLMTLQNELATRETNQMPRGREYRELSRVLPYAIVLGGQERWLDALVAADDDATADPTDLDWYHAPATWHLADLPASMDAFVTTVTGTLFRRA